MGRGFTILPERWRVFFDDEDRPQMLGAGEADPPDTTVFVLRPLAFTLAERIGRMLRKRAPVSTDEEGKPVLPDSSEQESEREAEVTLGAVKDCLVDWSGLHNRLTNEPVPFNPAFIESLPPLVLYGLAMFAWRKANPDLEAALKNAASGSSPQPKPSSGTTTKDLQAAATATT